jgi:DNA-binding HxlR family transcriptional regulator
LRVENHDFCPIYESINLLQEKWTLHIVRSLLVGPKGFNELGRDIGGCNPTTLTQRLEKLEASGIVEKTVQSTMPPRTRYALTDAGLALQGVIDAVDSWGRQFLNRVAH